MTETIFDTAFYPNGHHYNSPNLGLSYHVLLQQFLSASYGLYTQFFIRRISSQAQQHHPHLRKWALKKYLRGCVQKYMLTDLQLLFLAHYCKANNWDLNVNFRIKQIQKVLNFGSNSDQSEKTCPLQLFLNLQCFFIKSYVGDQQQFQSIQEHIASTQPNFHQIYEQWVDSKDRSEFIVTPKKINQLYREYSKTCQTETIKKDYNEIVDILIDLSTSYSIMPSKKTTKQSDKRHSQNDLNIKPKQLQHSYPQIQDRKTKKINSNIFRISQNEQIYQGSSIPQPNSNMEGVDQKPKRKSSLMFQSLQSLSRKSEQLLAQNNKKQENVNQSRDDRSREKRPGTRVSLSFKGKQKPNETVLKYIKEPIAFNGGAEDKLRYHTNTNQNGSIRQNFSFLNLRSNRSSRSNSQLPFLWRPSQDSFFDKSKFN